MACGAISIVCFPTKRWRWAKSREGREGKSGEGKKQIPQVPNKITDRPANFSAGQGTLQLSAECGPARQSREGSEGIRAIIWTIISLLGPCLPSSLFLPPLLSPLGVGAEQRPFIKLLDSNTEREHSTAHWIDCFLQPRTNQEL